ncbi:MAG: lysylphosphatidylglycerol synthase domain-containing protein, partial [Bacteroidota bacterium]
MTDRQKGLLKTTVKLLISGVAMTIVFRSIDWPQTRNLLYALHPGYLIWAILFFASSKVVSAYRLLIYFGNIGLGISAWYNLQLAWLGMFYNLFLPGGIGGDGY